MEKDSTARVYGETIDIDSNAVKNFFGSRASERAKEHIDAPTILSGDTDIKHIERWTNEELERWFPLFRIDKDSCVFEIGFGTGRMTKYLTGIAKQYVGVDYVESFLDTVLEREDIVKNKDTKFFSCSLEQFLIENSAQYQGIFNRVFLSGGVFLYINDMVLQSCISKISDMLQESGIIYISEPIALEERLTLNSFYSENLHDTYSAIYRTEEEYREFFRPFLDKGFELKISQEFFAEDIKKMKETRQWIFILEKNVEESGRK